MSATLRALAAALLLAGALAACGGGSELSWCISGGSLSAGFNTADCPPDPDKKPS